AIAFRTVRLSFPLVITSLPPKSSWLARRGIAPPKWVNRRGGIVCRNPRSARVPFIACRIPQLCEDRPQEVPVDRRHAIYRNNPRSQASFPARSVAAHGSPGFGSSAESVGAKSVNVLGRREGKGSL